MLRTVLLGALFAICGAASAADIYVSTTGNDTTGTGSIGAPYATPRHAVQVANAGDTVIMRGGTYAGNYVEIQVDNLTMKSYPGEWAKISMPTSGTTSVVVWIYNTGARLEDFEIEGGSPYCIHIVPNCDGAELTGCKIHGSDWIGIKVSQPDNVKLRHCEIYDTGTVTAGGMGIDCVNGDDILIQDCHFHDCNGTGIYLKGGLRNAVVERNLVMNVAGDGILLGESTGVSFMDTVGNPNLYEAIDGVVRNNLIVNAANSGLITYGSYNCRWYNNTVYNCSSSNGAGIRLIKGAHAGYPDTPCKNAQFINNIIVPGNAARPFIHVVEASHDGSLTLEHNRYHNLATANGVFWDELVLATAAYNLSLSQWQTRTGFDGTSTTGDPDLSATTYHLNGSSPLIGQGQTLTGFTDDYDGNTRSGAWDIGADETGGTALQTPPPSGTIGTGGGVGAPGSPSAATNLVATLNGTAADLSWTDNSANETGFRIERRIGTGGYAVLTTLAADVTSYSDAGLAAGTYTYRVYAYNASGDSAASNEDTVAVSGGGGSGGSGGGGGGGGCTVCQPGTWLAALAGVALVALALGRLTRGKA
ncbi:MAG: right-handed parallel beta-helix repeat-containing protein [Planctomycetes bacterium]|nr:right-handed parallel beta-helix repeat-containing protein [Planctomycetota bacterium]